MEVKIVETCNISPPSGSAPLTTLPLTIFDLPWLFFPPSKFLFFYDFPLSTTTTLPSLKLSLSLTLKHFFPLAGNLSPAGNGNPQIVYTPGDSVSLTVAQCGGEANFSHLCSYAPRNASLFHPLVPDLDSTSSPLPLLALKITVFPNSGICIGIAYHFVVGDGRTCNHFLKTWASIFKSVVGGQEPAVSIESLPFYDRTVIEDEFGLEAIFLNQWRKGKCSQEMVVGSRNGVLESDHEVRVRATFVMGPKDMEAMKQRIADRCRSKNMSLPIHMSPSVLACALAWVCLVRTQEDAGENHSGPNYFGYLAGGLTRLKYSVPITYFGNCVGFCRSEADRKDLLGEDGIIVATNVIGNRVKESDKAFLGRAERWISEWDVLVGSDIHVMVIGSPKLDIYETDFGWGRARKVEEMSSEGRGKRRGISLSQSRDVEGGIEVGVSLPQREMEYFGKHFNQGLKALPIL